MLNKWGIIHSSRSLIIDVADNHSELKFEYFDHERTSSISIKMEESDSDTDEDDPEAQLISKKSHSSKNDIRNRKTFTKSENLAVPISGEEVLEW